MAQTYFNETLVFNNAYTPAPYRLRKIRDLFLISTDHGAWIVLNKNELNNLLKGTIDDDLFKKLEEKGIIFTLSNKMLIEDYYSHRYSFLSTGTSLHIIIPTLRCNHKCVYCHSSVSGSDKKDKDMTKQIAKKTIDFIFQTPSKSITIEFQGGDALLNLNIFKFIVESSREVNKIYQKQVRFALVTNLTLINQDFLDWISKSKDISVCSSLDGPEFIHNLNRTYEDGKPTYKKVVNGIKKVTNIMGRPPGLLMVTTKFSLPYYKEIIDEYVRHGQQEIQLKYINRLGFAATIWNTIGYSIDDFIIFWKKSMDYILNLNNKGIFIKERYAYLILKKILTPEDPNFLDFRSPCGIVMGQLAYNYNGDIYSCDEGRNFELFKLGNVDTNSYKEILTQDKSLELVNASINDNYLCDNCVYKPFCGTCPVLNYAEEGNIIPKLSVNSRCKLFKMMFDYVFDKLIFDKEAQLIFFKWMRN
jgi:His-Xaa-Ser system radical SAM maturase HxsB